MPERLPARRADCCGRFLERSTHCVENWFDYSEGQWKRNKNISQDDCAGSKHQLNAMRREKAAECPVRTPQQQECEACDSRRNSSGQRDGHDQRVASPEVVTRQNIGCKQAEDYVE